MLSCGEGISQSQHCLARGRSESGVRGAIFRSAPFTDRSRGPSGRGRGPGLSCAPPRRCPCKPPDSNGGCGNPGRFRHTNRPLPRQAPRGTRVPEGTCPGAITAWDLSVDFGRRPPHPRRALGGRVRCPRGPPDERGQLRCRSVIGDFAVGGLLPKTTSSRYPLVRGSKRFVTAHAAALPGTKKR